MTGHDAVAGDRDREREQRFGATRPPRSPITASRTPVGARRAAAGLLSVTPDRWGDFWHWPARLLLSAVFEAAAVTRAGSRCGHTLTDRVGGDGSPMARVGRRRGLRRFCRGSRARRRVLRSRSATSGHRRLPVIRSGSNSLRRAAPQDRGVCRWMGLDRLAARPPEISAGSWFSAHWMAAATPRS
jgi:hypothetical protein